MSSREYVKPYPDTAKDGGLHLLCIPLCSRGLHSCHRHFHTRLVVWVHKLDMVIETDLFLRSKRTQIADMVRTRTRLALGCVRRTKTVGDPHHDVLDHSVCVHTPHMGSKVASTFSGVRPRLAQVADEGPAPPVLQYLVLGSVPQCKEEAATWRVTALKRPRMASLVPVQALQLDVALCAICECAMVGLPPAIAWSPRGRAGGEGRRPRLL